MPGPSNVNGGLRTFKFCYSTYTISTSFQNINAVNYSGGTAWLLTGLVLPDGTTWRFDYDKNLTTHYGDLTDIYTPTGAHISYTWTVGDDGCTTYAAGYRIVTSRTVNDGVSSNTWKYNFTFLGTTGNIVTDPLGNDTVYMSGYCSGTNPEIMYYAGSLSQGATLLKTVTKTYRGLPNPFIMDTAADGADPLLLAATTTTWANGQQSQEVITYDSGFTFNDNNPDAQPYGATYTSSYGLALTESHANYGNNAPGPVLSVTNTNYKALTTPSYATANLLDLPISVVITDGSTPGKVCAETDFGYDEYTPDLSGVTEQHVSPPSAVSGNLTSITRQLFTNPCSTPTPSETPLKTTRHVYDTGMIHTVTDALNNPPTTYGYSGTYYGAFPTSVCNPLNQCTTYGYDFNTGLMTSMVDPNSQTTSFPFYDIMLRPTQANYPDGGQISIAYNYSGNMFVGDTITKKITSSLSQVTTQIFDGLGRPKQTKATVPTSTCSSGFSYLDTTYDGDGRTFSVSNPYCTTGDATYGLTKTFYDPLNRTCLVVPPDGTVPSGTSCPATPPVNDIFTAYIGNATTVTDQAGNQRRSISDAQGRLTEVDEPGPGSGTASDATGIVGVYGIEQAWISPFTYDVGTVWITVNNVKETVSYDQNSSPTSLATALASAFNADNNSPVTASANGIYVTLTSKSTGTTSDYPVSGGSSTAYPTHFIAPSFAASPASPTLNCGSSGSTTVYSVCTPVVTAYTYNALDGLTQVLQAGSRQRTFVYDSLSRLTQATNPESGAINYTYDANSNVLTKTDARGITINYSPSNAAIDPLNRVRGKTYSNGDPEVTYAYDGNAPVGCTPPALSDPYPIGRRTSMCDAAGNEAWSHDKMGRVAADLRTTNGVTKTTTYATPSVPYNFDGSVAQLTYPSGRTITYTPNSAAQSVSAIDTANSVNYATMALYGAQGALRSLTNGTSILSTLYYNNRLQPCRIAVNSSGTAPGTCGDGTNYGNVLDYSYNFNLGTSDDGNVMAITNNLTKNTPTDRSQSFTYDVLNRIATAGTISTSGANCWGEKYGYDAWGNLLSVAGITPQYNGCSQESGFSITVNASNQIAGFCYDAAGNLLAQSAPPCPSPTYVYNAENQLTSTAGVTYTYDGNGKRVQKSNGKLYWYGMGSDALDESDASGNIITNEYIFFGGKRIARRDSSGNVDYYFADHLGTARVVTNATGTPQDDSDFYPFGGQRALLSSSGNTYKFTGKERDSESGLDNFGARYDSSQYGRFMTPDPIGATKPKLTDPQQWNAYSYVRNNPLRLVDNNGKWPTEIHYQIIDKAFPGLTAAQREILKTASFQMDHCPACQMSGNAYQHSMRAPHQSVENAKAETKEFIKGNETIAQSYQSYEMPTSVSQITNSSLGYFGIAAHTVADGTSPEHVDAQSNPLPWDPSDLASVIAHDSGESTISPEQMGGTVEALHQFFRDTFGDEAARQAETPQPEPSRSQTPKERDDDDDHLL